MRETIGGGDPTGDHIAALQRTIAQQHEIIALLKRSIAQDNRSLAAVRESLDHMLWLPDTVRTDALRRLLAALKETRKGPLE